MDGVENLHPRKTSTLNPAATRRDLHPQMRRAGLGELKLNDLRRINLISGQNDMGKTAILEALYLHAAGPFAAAQALQVLQPFRGQQAIELNQGVTESPWTSFFENFDTAKPIRLLGVSDEEGEYELLLTLPTDSDTVSVPVANADGSSVIATAALQVRESFASGSVNTRRQTVTVQGAVGGGGLAINQITLNFKLEPVFASDRVHRKATIVRGAQGPDLAQGYSELRRAKRSLNLTEALRGIDERINGLEILTRGGQSVLHVELNDGLVMPLSLLGDGPVLLARCLLSMVLVGRGGIILIDEIENGLHWSVLSHVWSSIYRAAERLDIQVFATTHSRECLAAATEALSSRADQLTLHRIGPRVNDGPPLVGTYDQNKLRSGFELNLDLR